MERHGSVPAAENETGRRSIGKPVSGLKIGTGTVHGVAR